MQAIRRQDRQGWRELRGRAVKTGTVMMSSIESPPNTSDEPTHAHDAIIHRKTPHAHPCYLLCRSAASCRDDILY